MKNIIALSTLVLLTVCIFLRLASANQLILTRLQGVPTKKLLRDSPSNKRIKLGTFLHRQSNPQQQYNRYLSPSSHGASSNSAALPVVNFTNMDGILLNMLMRRMSN